MLVFFSLIPQISYFCSLKINTFQNYLRFSVLAICSDILHKTTIPCPKKENTKKLDGTKNHWVYAQL